MSEMVEYEGEAIRRVWLEDEPGNGRWVFAVVDVIQVITQTVSARKYWYNLHTRTKEREGIDLRERCVRLKLKHQNNRTYETDCADIEWLLRIIQSIPSPNAEPFKQWLAQVGRERLEEQETPELAIERLRQAYLDKGYSEEWVEARLQSIVTRNELTDEWLQRKVEPRKFGFLTAEISKGAFNIKPGEHKQFKGLKKKDSLRDHMTRLELLFTMLGEEATTQIARNRDAQGYKENYEAAQDGGQVAGDSRRLFEGRTGKPVLSEKNFHDISERQMLEDGDAEDEDLPF